jgi:hypothetical protein
MDGDMGNAHTILIGKSERKTLLGRPRRKWNDNIKMDIIEIVVDWIQPAQDRVQWRVLVDTVLNLRFRIRARDFLTS